MSHSRIAGYALAFWLKVGLAASLFILAVKWLTSKVSIPGLSAAAAAL
jgi:hypothetical protein